MEDIQILGRDEGHDIFRRFVAQYDVPAYIRRAQRVQDAFEELLGRCRRQRDEWLAMVRLRLGTLCALAGDWSRLGPLLAEPADVSVFRSLYASLEPRLRTPVTPSASPRVLRRALHELMDSTTRFNDRWDTFLKAVDLAPINELRDGYNRYFLVEKECAVRSARVARQGFRRLELLTVENLIELLPYLPLVLPKE
jgi:hypothetical protein